MCTYSFLRIKQCIFNCFSLKKRRYAGKSNFLWSMNIKDVVLPKEKKTMKKKDKKNPMALSKMGCTWDEWKPLLQPFFSSPNYTIAFPEVDKRPLFNQIMRVRRDQSKKVNCRINFLFWAICNFLFITGW